MMTREEEVARLAEIEAQHGTSDRLKKGMREYFERRWALQDAGDNILDMSDAWVKSLYRGVRK